jgi:hypothetical protein
VINAPLGTVASSIDGGGPFVPPSGLFVWLDAEDASTLTLDGSNNVTGWADKSAIGNNFAPVSTAAPLLTVNGHDYINISSSANRRMRNLAVSTDTDGAGVTNVTVFVVPIWVTARAVDEGDRCPFQYSTVNRIPVRIRRSSTSNPWATTASAPGLADNVINYGGGNWTLDTPKLVTYRLDTAENLTLSLNGVQVGSTSAATTQLTLDNRSMIVGGRNSTTSESWPGGIGEILYFNRALTNEEVLSVESYLMDKWGI